MLKIHLTIGGNFAKTGRQSLSLPGWHRKNPGRHYFLHFVSSSFFSSSVNCALRLSPEKRCDALNCDSMRSTKDGRLIGTLFFVQRTRQVIFRNASSLPLPPTTTICNSVQENEMKDHQALGFRGRTGWQGIVRL